MTQKFKTLEQRRKEKRTQESLRRLPKRFLAGTAIFLTGIAGLYGYDALMDRFRDKKQKTELHEQNTNPDIPYANNFDILEEEKTSNNPVTNNFIEKLIMKESTNNPRAKSQKGARGLMQIMKPTWDEVSERIYGKRIDYSLAYDPKKNKEIGIAYLNQLDLRLKKDLKGYSNMNQRQKQEQLAAAYNGGITRFLRIKGDISKMPAETKEYVEAVTN